MKVVKLRLISSHSKMYNSKIKNNMACFEIVTFFFVGVLTIVLASEAVKDNSDENMASEEDASPSVGVLDVIVLLALAIGALYWFFGRKKEDDSAASTYVIQTTNVLQRQQSINKGFIAKMKNTDRRIVCFYGSQTVFRC